MKIKLKTNKGFTAIDLTVSIMIIIISVSVITNMFYNLYLSGSGIKRNVIATDYAINILELIEATDYELVTFNEDKELNLKNKLDEFLKTESKIENNIYTSNANNFDIAISIEKYSEQNEVDEEKEDYIKIITVKITYSLGKNSDKTTNKETLTISTLKTIR